MKCREGGGVGAGGAFFWPKPHAKTEEGGRGGEVAADVTFTWYYLAQKCGWTRKEEKSDGQEKKNKGGPRFPAKIPLKDKRSPFLPEMRNRDQFSGGKSEN